MTKRIIPLLLMWMSACAQSLPTEPTRTQPPIQAPPQTPVPELPIPPPLRIIISGYPTSLEQGITAIFYSEAVDATGPVVYTWQFAYEDGSVPPASISTIDQWVFHQFPALGYVTIRLHASDTRTTADAPTLLLQVHAPCPPLFPQCFLDR